MPSHLQSYEGLLLPKIIEIYSELKDKGPDALKLQADAFRKLSDTAGTPAARNQALVMADVLDELAGKASVSADDISRILRERYTQYFSPKLQGPDEPIPVRGPSGAERIKALRQQAALEAIQRAQAVQWQQPVAPPPLSTPQAPPASGVVPQFPGVTMTSAPPVMHVETVIPPAVAGRTLTTSFAATAASPMQDAARIVSISDKILDSVLKATQGPSQNLQAIKLLGMLEQNLPSLKTDPNLAAALLQIAPDDLKPLIQEGGDDMAGAIRLASSRLASRALAEELLEGARKLGQAPLTEYTAKEASELAKILRTTPEEVLVRGFAGTDPKALTVWRQVAQKPTFDELRAIFAQAGAVHPAHLREALIRTKPQVIDLLEDVARKAREAATKATQALPVTTPAVKTLPETPPAAPRTGYGWLVALPIALTLLSMLLSGKKRGDFKWIRYDEQQPLVTR